MFPWLVIKPSPGNVKVWVKYTLLVISVFHSKNAMLGPIVVWITCIWVHQLWSYYIGLLRYGHIYSCLAKSLGQNPVISIRIHMFGNFRIRISPLKWRSTVLTNRKSAWFENDWVVLHTSLPKKLRQKPHLLSNIVICPIMELVHIQLDWSS